MAVNKKTSNTSKTAHVMNLLSKSKSAPQSGVQTAEPAPQAESSPAPAPVSPVIASIAPDAAVSEQIKDALEGALESELAAGAPPQEKPQPQAEPPQSEPEPIPQPEPEPIPQPQPEPVSNPEQEPSAEPEPQPEPESQAEPEPVQSVQTPTVEEVPPPSDAAHPGISYVNVMQVLVEEKVDKYIKMFGLCQCPRCVIDVKALALNNLPPKYVVMPPGEVVPRISVYEGRFNTAVIAQIMWACKKVMENPRHDL